jgi:hypothetical protein
MNNTDLAERIAETHIYPIVFRLHEFGDLVTVIALGGFAFSGHERERLVFPDQQPEYFRSTLVDDLKRLGAFGRTGDIKEPVARRKVQ